MCTYMHITYIYIYMCIYVCDIHVLACAAPGPSSPSGPEPAARTRPGARGRGPGARGPGPGARRPGPGARSCLNLWCLNVCL